MKRWIKVAIFAMVLAVPVTAYAYQQYSAQHGCPFTDSCPCSH